MEILKKKRGFTLFELLSAIVVISILVWVLVPTITKILGSARRVKGANCLKQIATAYTQYCNDDVNGRNISNAKTGKEWALILARSGYLNDPSVYSFSGDSSASKAVKETIVDLSLNDNKAWGEGDDIEFSVYLINNIPVNAPLATTPVAFTRGIPKIDYDPEKKVAKWPGRALSPKDSGVYGSKGGYIAYLDGHVEWYKNLGNEEEGKLAAWNGSGMTNDITKAIPSIANILSASKEINSPIKIESSK